MRLWHRVDYFARAAIRGLVASPVTSVAAVLTIAVMLVPVGAVWITTRNMSALLEDFGSDLRLTAFLTHEADSDDARRVAERAAGLPGVASVEIIAKEEAMTRFRARLGNDDLLEALDENPFPYSLEIRLAAESRDEAGFAAVADALEGSEGLESVAGGEAWVQGYARALRLIRGIGLGLAFVLGSAALLIVGITIRLGLYARRSELEILALVGASRTFLRTPFLLEGALQGSLGGALGLLLLGAGFGVAIPRVQAALALFLGWANPVFLDTGQMISLVFFGALLGVLGAAVAVWSTRLS